VAAGLISERGDQRLGLERSRINAEAAVKNARQQRGGKVGSEPSMTPGALWWTSKAEDGGSHIQS